MCEYDLRWFDVAGALAELRSSGVEIPLIVASGSIQPGAAAESLEAGAQDFIAKDRPLGLGQAVDVALERTRDALRRSTEQSGVRRISSSPPRS